MLHRYFPAFRIALFWSLFAYILCFVNLAYRLNLRASEISLLPHGLTFELYMGQNQLPEYVQCNGIWTCSYQLCRIRDLANLSTLGIMISEGWDSKCNFKGLSFIWEWKYARASVMLLVFATLFEAFALMVGAYDKNFRWLCFYKRTIYTILILLASILLILAYLFELIWTQSYRSQSEETQPLSDQVWYFILTFLALVNLVHANYGVAVFFRFDYRELE